MCNHVTVLQCALTIARDTGQHKDFANLMNLLFNIQNFRFVSSYGGNIVTGNKYSSINPTSARPKIHKIKKFSLPDWNKFQNNWSRPKEFHLSKHDFMNRWAIVEKCHNRMFLLILHDECMKSLSIRSIHVIRSGCLWPMWLIECYISVLTIAKTLSYSFYALVCECLIHIRQEEKISDKWSCGITAIGSERANPGAYVP